VRDRSVLLACASDWASPARLARVLVDGGARVVAMTAPRRPLATTRFASRVIAAPPDVDGFVTVLREHLRTHNYRWIVLADDPLITAVRDARHQSWLDGVLPIRGAWSDVIASKAALCARATAAGYPIAPSRVCGSLDDARRALVALGSPVVIKQSSEFAGRGVRLVASEGELAQVWRALAAPSEPLVVQRFIAGPVGNTAFLMDRGRPVQWMSAFKARTYAGQFGPSSARRFMDHPDARVLVSRLGELTGYHGFGALDWIHGTDDRLHVIELNTRPVPAIHLATRAGIDFARGVRELLAGRSTGTASPSVRDDTSVHAMFPEDLWRMVTEGKVELRSLFGQCGIARDVPWDDPRLVLHHVLAMSRALLAQLAAR
jgi:predicted ATP-grasp superfamily ATP-dependent carboligase